MIIEQEDIKITPRGQLLYTAQDIQQYRLATLSPEAQINSVNRKILTLSDIRNDLYQAEEFNTRYGTLHEALFYIEMQQLGIPISPSNDQDDTRGIDFWISNKCCKPIDVTINPQSDVLQEKIKRNNAIVLCLPIYTGQTTLMQDGADGLLLQKFLQGELDPQDYLGQVIAVNKDLENAMKVSKQPQKQIQQLQHLLGYLSRVLEKLQ